MRKSKALLVYAIILALVILPALPVEVMPARGYSFGSPQPLVSFSGYDTAPAALQASDGTMWVAWQSITGLLIPHSDLYYMTYNGLGWSSVKNLTTTSRTFNYSPTLTQLRNSTILLLWPSNATGHYNLYYKRWTGSVWTAPAQVTFCSCDDLDPKAAVGPDSTLWVVWERDSPGPVRQIYYKTLRGNSWSSDTQLTFDNTGNITPGVLVTKEGLVRFTWSKFFSTNGGGYSVYYQVYNNTQLSPPVPLTSVNYDTSPNLMQDRNGTLWLFWNRDMPLGGGITQYKLWYELSSNLGQSWSPSSQLTFSGNSTTPIDDKQPSAIQGLDKSLWVFFSTDLSGGGSSFDIYYIKSNSIFPVHDVDVTSLQVSPVKIFPWYIVTVNVTVADLGDLSESVSLTVQATGGTVLNIGSASASLASGSSKTFTFSWNATGSPPGRYTVVASVPLVPGETVGNGVDNTLRFNTLNIYIPGDLDKNGCVDTLDASILLFSYGTTIGSPGFNSDADLNRDGWINIIDLGMWASSFGKCI